MNLTELIAAARTDILDDTVSPYLWSDAQLTRYANEAIKEACKRAPLLRRTYNVKVISGKAEYTLESSVRTILFAKLNNQVESLAQSTDAALSAVDYQWRDLTGVPKAYVRTNTKLRLYPNPTTDDVLVLNTTNIPDEDFDLEDEFDQTYIESLMYWIAYKAYMLNDADTFNPVKASEFRQLFDAAFGLGHSAKWDQVAQDNPLYNTIASVRMC